MRDDKPRQLTGPTDGGQQYLTFQLQQEEYALDILRVQEIKGLARITPIPNAAAEIKGVMNLRGTVVPVVDLRTKFQLPQAEYSKFTVIIVVTVGARVVGLVVDAVSDVLNIDRADIEAAPDLGGTDTSFMTGMAKAGDRLITLLNIDRLLGQAEPAAAAAAG